MPTQASSQGPAEVPAAGAVERIVVRILVGEHRMAASDDPLFLCLKGPEGREFRLDLAKGTGLRRGKEDVYVLAAADSPDVNVANPALNDPCCPVIHASGIERVALRKGHQPIPNVRGFGEMDDRLQIEEAEVEIHTAGRRRPLRFLRRGPHWLGLVCGLTIDLTRSPERE